MTGYMEGQEICIKFTKPHDIVVITINYLSFYTLSTLSFSKEMSRGECWKFHFRAFRFKYFLPENAHRPPYKLAPSAPAFKAPHLKYAPLSLCNNLLYGLPAKSLSKLQRLQSAAANCLAILPHCCTHQRPSIYMTKVKRALWLVS